jgi:protein tyrosine/serine phosphatase
MTTAATTSSLTFAAKRRRALIFWVVLLLIGALLTVFWKDIERLPRRFIPRNLGTVEEGKLYRSGQIHRSLLPDVIKDKNIGAIVCLTYDPGKEDFDAEPGIAKSMGVDHTVIKGLNGKGIGNIELYADALRAMKNAVDAGKPVLVHCAAGAQRTGAAFTFWKLLVEGKSVEIAQEHLYAFGHDPDDNDQLIPYVNANMKRLAELLVANGTIEKIPDPIPQLKLP